MAFPGHVPKVGTRGSQRTLSCNVPEKKRKKIVVEEDNLVLKSRFTFPILIHSKEENLPVDNTRSRNGHDNVVSVNVVP